MILYFIKKRRSQANLDSLPQSEELPKEESEQGTLFSSSFGVSKIAEPGPINGAVKIKPCVSAGLMADSAGSRLSSIMEASRSTVSSPSGIVRNSSRLPIVPHGCSAGRIVRQLRGNIIPRTERRRRRRKKRKGREKENRSPSVPRWGCTDYAVRGSVHSAEPLEREILDVLETYTRTMRKGESGK